MKKFQVAFVAGILLISFRHSNAQILSPESLGSGGAYSSAGGIRLDQHIGGLAITSISNENFLYTQGFLQPDAGVTSTVPFINDVTLTGGYGIDNAGTTFINGNIMLEFTTGEPASITHINGTNMLTQGLLQPYPVNMVLPVTGFDLVARRTDAGHVMLNWKTLQEFNNKGFHIERKLTGENNFTVIGYIPSAALNGNSSLPLLYEKNDNNSFTGKTWYRIRQEDIGGSSTYSPTRLVNGSSNVKNMKVWPIPSPGPVNVLVNGITSRDKLMVFDINGRLVQQHTIQNNVALTLHPMTAGTYIIRLAESKDLLQKIVVQ